MKLSFDHLVWFSKRPEDSIFPLKEKGIHAVNGGRHESWGTYNSLTYFGLSYIEFLGIENLSIAKTHEENRLVTQIVEKLSKEDSEGPATIAIRTDCIDDMAKKLKQEGFTVYGPLQGERVRADGVIIRWSLVFPEDSGSELSLPFFIQWEKSDGERLREFENQGLIGLHTAGQLKFESVGFVVHNLDGTLQRWGKLFNLEKSGEYIDSTVNARCRILKLAGTELLFCSPIGEGPAAKALKEKGEIPFLVNLTEASENQFFKMMNGYWRFQS